MQMHELNGIERVMNVTKVGEVVTLIETKKSTYQRTRRGLKRAPIKELDEDYGLFLQKRSKPK